MAKDIHARNFPHIFPFKYWRFSLVDRLWVSDVDQKMDIFARNRGVSTIFLSNYYYSNKDITTSKKNTKKKFFFFFKLVSFFFCVVLIKR